jgi:metal-sulfur cluster biosynthetic enzyme
MLDADTVRAAVNEVIDPCSRAAGVPAGLVDMGMITDIGVVDGPDGAAVSVTIQMTEPTCIMGHAFIPAVRDRVRQLAGVGAVDVRLDLSFGWDPSRLDPGYRERLDAHHAKRGTPSPWAAVQFRSGVSP